ncbi:RHS repeat-associated core domain-containing protein [Tenggerimyces flavus]|uniref:RHS repeat-associated core domain-containing protein n=1 Tax=Tenggerimyces flavus TaxID=1708749 RepID=A0ABV7YNY7_9ACTN
MGVRLYAAALGRFLQTDPVPGGNANPYTYPLDPVNEFDLDGKKKCRKWHCRLGRWAWKNKWDIALTAAGFIPGLGALAWGYRAYRLYRLVRTAHRMGKVRATFRSTRATSWLAGRMWVGRGAYRDTAKNGARWLRSHKHHRSWRSARKKGKHGYSSNFDYRTPGHHKYWSAHVNHRKYRRWARWW